MVLVKRDVLGNKKMKYVILCGGKYTKWKSPRWLTKINGESIVNRTIRLLKENGIEDIAIVFSDETLRNTLSNECINIPLIFNAFNDYEYDGEGYEKENYKGYWVNGLKVIDFNDAWYLYGLKGKDLDDACYLFGDVVYSKAAIQKIIKTETDDIEFFASSPPFSNKYHKEWAEPFAFKVTNGYKFNQAIEKTKRLYDEKCFRRHPIAWELWQVIKETPINIIDYSNYTVINDYTCDIDNPEDIKLLEGEVRNE